MTGRMFPSNRSFPVSAVLTFVGLFGLLCSAVDAQEASYPTPAELKARYGFNGWPGGAGPIYAGVDPEVLKLDDWSPGREPFVKLIDVKEQDRTRETPVTDHAVRMYFVLGKPGAPLDRHALNVDIRVARTGQSTNFDERFHNRTSFRI